jgi:hypothetical protein
MIKYILPCLTPTELIGMHISVILMFTFSFSDYTSLLMMLILIVAQLPCPAILYWVTVMMKMKFVLVNRKLNA